MIDEFFTTPDTPPTKHLILIIHTRSPIKTRFAISRLRSHTRQLVENSTFAKSERKKATAQGNVYKWEDMVRRVHFLGVEADLCDLKAVYALADRLVNGTVGSPDATTFDGLKLPHGSPGTQSFSGDAPQDRWALSQEEGSSGFQRSWGWGLSGIRLPRLDVVILNAGMGGWHTINWGYAVWHILTDTIHAMTWPQFKIGRAGSLAKPQLSSPAKAAIAADESAQPLLSDQEKADEPPLGLQFCSNTFGHYILTHELMPLLSRTASPASRSSGRIIWVSSIEAVPDVFDINDIQGLKSTKAYEGTKRLTDLLVLTSQMPSVKLFSAPFFEISGVSTPLTPASVRRSSGAWSPTDDHTLLEARKQGKSWADIQVSYFPHKTANACRKRHERLIERIAENMEASTASIEVQQGIVKPNMYVLQPGIFASEILPLNAILVFIYKLVFVFTRWIGGMWYVVDPYKGAVAPVWLALSSEEHLEDLDATASKWGSAASPNGDERVTKTEVEWYGWERKLPEGEIAGEKLKGRNRYAVNASKESRENFEIQGAKCWREMEKLRKQWEDLLGVKK